MQALRRMVVFGFEGDYKTLRHVPAVDQVRGLTHAKSGCHVFYMYI